MEDVSILQANIPNNVSDSVTHGLPVGETRNQKQKLTSYGICHVV
jgi:hypothetical protein